MVLVYFYNHHSEKISTSFILSLNELLRMKCIRLDEKIILPAWSCLEHSGMCLQHAKKNRHQPQLEKQLLLFISLSLRGIIRPSADILKFTVIH